MSINILAGNVIRSFIRSFVVTSLNRMTISTSCSICVSEWTLALALPLSDSFALALAVCDVGVQPRGKGKQHALRWIERSIYVARQSLKPSPSFFSSIAAHILLWNSIYINWHITRLRRRSRQIQYSHSVTVWINSLAAEQQQTVLSFSIHPLSSTFGVDPFVYSHTFHLPVWLLTMYRVDRHRIEAIMWVKNCLWNHTDGVREYWYLGWCDRVRRSCCGTEIAGKTTWIERTERTDKNWNRQYFVWNWKSFFVRLSITLNGQQLVTLLLRCSSRTKRLFFCLNGFSRFRNDMSICSIRVYLRTRFAKDWSLFYWWDMRYGLLSGA